MPSVPRARRRPAPASRRTRWNACAGPRSPAPPAPPAPSRDVSGLGRHLAGLRALEQPSEVGVAHLRQRLLARARALRRIPGDADLAVVAGAGNEQEGELVAIVLRDAAGREHAPGAAGVRERTGRHVTAAPLRDRCAQDRAPAPAPTRALSRASWHRGPRRIPERRRAAPSPRTRCTGSPPASSARTCAPGAPRTSRGREA